MDIWVWGAVGGVAAWLVVAVLLAEVLGRRIRLADQRSAAAAWERLLTASADPFVPAEISGGRREGPRR